jgi:hypothetical protein
MLFSIYMLKPLPWLRSNLAYRAEFRRYTGHSPFVLSNPHEGKAMSKIGCAAVIAESGSAPAETDAIHESKPTDNTHPVVPPDTESADTEISPNQNSPQGLAATGKFTRSPKKLFELSSKELEETLTQLADDKLDLFARSYSSSDQKQTGFLARWRCVCGAICSVKRARIHACYAQDILTIGWQDWCDSVGLNRKSAERYEQNWRTVIDAPQTLVEAANREGLDLLQPRIANHLREVLAELAGKEPTEAELPELLNRLDLPAPPETKKKKKGRANKPKSIAAARQAFSKVIEKIPEKEMETADALFHTFATSAPTAQMSVVVRSLFWNYVNSSTSEQKLGTAELFLETVQAEVEDLRNKLIPPIASDESTDEQPAETLNQQDPSPESIADSALPSFESEPAPSSELRPLFCQPETTSSSEPNPGFWATGEWQNVEITGKPDLTALTGSLPTEDSDDDGDDLTIVSTEATLERSDSGPSSEPTVDGLSPSPETAAKLPSTPERAPSYLLEELNPELKGTFIKFGPPQPFEISGHPFDISGHPIEFDEDKSEVDENTAVGGRKPPARETFDEAFVDSLAAGL